MLNLLDIEKNWVKKNNFIRIIFKEKFGLGFYFFNCVIG